MKFVSASSFRNTHHDLIKVTDPLNGNHVHKGARFAVGGNLPLEDLSEREKELVAILNRTGRIVAASQTEDVAKIDAEVKGEKAVEARLRS